MARSLARKVSSFNIAGIKLKLITPHFLSVLTYFVALSYNSLVHAKSKGELSFFDMQPVVDKVQTLDDGFCVTPCGMLTAVYDVKIKEGDAFDEIS